jgi:hypothetical protein
MARTMIHENNLAKHFWAVAVNTTCYVQNRIYIRPIFKKQHMNSLREEDPISLTIINLDVLVTF